MNKAAAGIAVTESWISVPVAAGEMGGYLAKPAGTPRGGIVLLQEIFGVNAAMRDKARDFANEGFAVLAPDMFWRSAARVDLGYGEEDRKRGFGLMQQYDQAIGAADIGAAVSWLAKTLGAKPVALIGFCLGGRMAVLAGAGHPDVAAIVSLYGVRLDLCADKLLALTVPFQFHVGDKDAHVPAEHIAAVREAVAGKSNAEVFVYHGAQHGFYNRLRGEVYSADAAARGHILRLLDKVTR
jgi:carboxymethylenebutenolidase